MIAKQEKHECAKVLLRGGMSYINVQKELHRIFGHGFSNNALSKINHPLSAKEPSACTEDCDPQKLVKEIAFYKKKSAKLEVKAEVYLEIIQKHFTLK